MGEHQHSNTVLLSRKPKSLLGTLQGTILRAGIQRIVGLGFLCFGFFFFFGGGRVFFLILLHISLPPNYISQFAASQEVTNLQHSLSWSNTRSTMRPTTTHWSCSTYELLHLQAGLHRQTDDLFLTCVGICLLQQLGARVHICKSSNSKAVRGMQLGLKKVAAVFSNIHQLQ